MQNNTRITIKYSLEKVFTIIDVTKFRIFFKAKSVKNRIFNGA